MIYFFLVPNRFLCLCVPTVCSSIHLQKDILVASRFWQLRIKLLQTTMCRICVDIHYQLIGWVTTRSKHRCMFSLIEFLLIYIFTGIWCRRCLDWASIQNTQLLLKDLATPWDLTECTHRQHKNFPDGQIWKYRWSWGCGSTEESALHNTQH